MSVFRNNAFSSAILNGANAPKVAIQRNALRTVRPSPGATRDAGISPNNAAPQNYRAGMPGTKQVTPVQAAFVNAIARSKKTSGTTPGASSWRGKLFGS